MIIPCVNPCQTCSPFIGGASGPADPDFPFVNLSSEAPDVDNFIGQRFGPRPGNPGGGPPLGNLFYAIGCIGWCVSATSQDEADLCADRQMMECLQGNWPEQPPGGGPEVPFTPFPSPFGPFMTLYRNSEQSCDFTCPDGQVFTYTVPVGTFTAFNQAAADASAKSYACQKAVQYHMCIGDLTPELWCANVAYSGSITMTSGLPPFTYNIIGDLPDGIVASSGNPNSLLLTGTATVAGDYSFSVQVTDARGNTMTRLFNLIFFGITTNASLPEATVDEPYSQAITVAGSVTGAVTFTLSGVLPSGLTMNATTGTISGTPDSGTEGEYNFTITAHTGGISCPKEFFLIVDPVPPDCPDWTTLAWGSPTETTAGSATCSVTPGGGASDSFSLAMQTFSDGAALGNNTGTVIHNGPLCNCRVNLTMTTNDALGFFNSAYIIVSSSLFGQLLLQTFDASPPGNYQYNFVLPDTGGLDDTITFFFEGSLADFISGSLVFNGQVVNV